MFTERRAHNSTRRITARSLSRPTWEQLQRESRPARVLAVFEHACDLIAPDGSVIALVATSLDDGPFHIVVDAAPGIFRALRRDIPALLGRDALWLAGLQIDLRGARRWEPCPSWGTLRARRQTIDHTLSYLYTFCSRMAIRQMRDSLFFPLLHADGLLDRIDQHGFSCAQSAVEAIRQGWNGDRPALQRGAAALAGLGKGLTPAGDDFLLGLLLYAWLFHPDPQTFCTDVVDIAAPRTTTLSAAFLRAGARGECSAPWHCLFDALSCGHEGKIALAVQRLLDCGATSGADSLLGFLHIARSRRLFCPPNA
ncbi:MAG: DUF2877 domain-containing protein [Anaerolineae bacterium]|nr:DUF2877 domain-containing protein [Anaerolineae bacterium]